MNMQMDMPSISLVMPNERLDSSGSRSFSPVLLRLFKRGRGQALMLIQFSSATRRFVYLNASKRRASA